MERRFVIWLHTSFLRYKLNILINAIDLYYRHRKKISFIKKERTCAHLELKETKNITHFLLLKAHSH